MVMMRLSLLPARKKEGRPIIALLHTSMYYVVCTYLYIVGYVRGKESAKVAGSKRSRDSSFLIPRAIISIIALFGLSAGDDRGPISHTRGFTLA